MSNPHDRRSLLRPEGSDLSDASTAISSPNSPSQRHGYRRMLSDSVDLTDRTSPRVDVVQHESDITSSGAYDGGVGLGIIGTPGPRPTSIQRVPVGAKTQSPQTPLGASPFQHKHNPSMSQGGTPLTPGSSNPLLSPSWQRQDANTYGYDGGGTGPMYGDAPGGTYSAPQARLSGASFHDNNADPFVGDDDTAGLKRSGTSMIDHGLLMPGCTTGRDIHTTRGSWLSVTILMLSIYSTIMSGLWLVTAMVQPRWGRGITSGGRLTPSTASLLSALFAKTIELSFVTVFVGFLGQVLSRRSFVRTSKGMSIAEMSMRTWIIQPGFMITHWQTLRYAGFTFLGAISLIVALVAMLYTTASDALVSPKLKFGKWEQVQLSGLVQASYANPIFVAQKCQTPITPEEDGVNSGPTCLSIEHAGQAFHNYITWIGSWAAINQNGTGESINLVDRPNAAAMLYDNTTIQGSWIMTNSSNMTASFEKYNRIINNVTMAMPHAGVFAAARDSINGIMQPTDLAGLGEYEIRASVVSPSVNVLCVNIAESELAPLVYTSWPNATTNLSGVGDQLIPLPGIGWLADVPPAGSPNGFINATAVDDIFEWGEKYGRHPPVFPMFPIDYNTLLNTSIIFGDTIYLLAKAPVFENYTICSLRSFLSPNCSTHYRVAGSAGGTMASLCEDPNDKEAYFRSVPNSPITISSDWKNVASQWATALSLNDGSLNANASNARLLSQLVPQTPILPMLKPSIAEALAVLAGNTLLMSSMGGPFVHYWEYQSNILSPGDENLFNASIITQQYTSGYAQKWQSVFYLVLLLVFATNVFCLVYFFLRSGLVTDYTEPQNLFALAVNSPPSDALAGSCGAGPEGYMFKVGWHVRMEQDTTHYYVHEAEGWRNGQGREGTSTAVEMAPKSPSLNSSYIKLSSKRRSWL